MEKLIINNPYWIDTVNYGVLKATYHEAGKEKIGYFQALLVDGILILNNNIRYVMDRVDDTKPLPTTPDMTPQERTAMGWRK